MSDHASSRWSGDATRDLRLPCANEEGERRLEKQAGCAGILKTSHPGCRGFWPHHPSSCRPGGVRTELESCVCGFEVAVLLGQQFYKYVFKPRLAERRRQLAANPTIAVRVAAEIQDCSGGGSV